MSAAHRAFYRVIEALLEERPDEWSHDQYHLRNPRAGIDIWIANKAYGLHVAIDGARLDPSWWWKRRLRHAADKHMAAKSIARMQDAIAKVAA